MKIRTEKGSKPSAGRIMIRTDGWEMLNVLDFMFIFKILLTLEEEGFLLEIDEGKFIPPKEWYEQFKK